MSWQLEADGRTRVLRQSLGGRIARGLRTGLTTSLVALVFLSVFYIPEYVTGDEAFDSFLAGYLVLGSATVGFVAGVMRALSWLRWELSASSFRVTGRTLGGQGLEESIPHSAIGEIEVVAGTLLFPSRLILHTEDGRAIEMAQQSSASGLEEIAAEIRGLSPSPLRRG